MFDIVVAADLDWGIGRANALPWPKLRADLQHFKRVTSAASEGKRAAVIMGRKTWESAEVAGRPLPRRLNIIITRRTDLSVPEAVRVAGSLDAALELAAQTPDVESTYVVGGAEIYREAFAHAALRYVYLTRVELHCGTDVHIPDLYDTALPSGSAASPGQARLVETAFVVEPWDGEQHLEEDGVRYRIERLVRR